MANKKILILGAKGNLGQQLVKTFAADNEVIAWDRGEIDITDRGLIFKKVADVKPELVVNAAAYNAVDQCEASGEEYELAKKINIDGPKYLAEACLLGGAALIHYSTNYVFDGEKKDGYRETDQPKPVNRYGKSKFHGEKRILELSGRGLKWHIIRTSKLFGPPAAGETSKRSFFDLMLELSQGKNKLEAVDEELSCFTYTPDLARATGDLIDKNCGYGIYHITNGGACTWYGAALELFRIAGTAVKVAPVSGDRLARPARRPKYAVLLNGKLPALRDYREALKEYLGK